VAGETNGYRFREVVGLEEGETL
jgi:hypothetical protein